MDLLSYQGVVLTETVERCEGIFKELESLELADKIATINAIRKALHAHSPFKNEPVDCIQWVRCGEVNANDYNPNSVAPPEMKLLEHSIQQDGYTQPIVAWQNGQAYEVVDGFHRNRVGKESPEVNARVHGYLPLAVVNDSRLDRSDRIAATIRHNRARGRHKVEAMSDIVIELKRRNWGDERISRELGMDQDEILRLCQITGLAELFSDQEFSRSWDVEGEVTESDFKELTDNVSSYGEETENFRTVNTSDENRIFHTHDKWECAKSCFYKTTKEGMSKKDCEEAYRAFLSDLDQFEVALERVISEWKNSCEHYLTNTAMNRIAWLGQASVAIALDIPSFARGGYHLLTDSQKEAADSLALKYLNIWLERNNRAQVGMDEAVSAGRQSDIY